MKQFIQQFTIHPMGQGLFYSGVFLTELSSQTSVFKFVFDCGSLTHANGNEETDTFRDEFLPNDNSMLDLLIISHFDADHINKIGRLLQGNRKIKNLVMPFTLLEERLFLSLRFIENSLSAEDEDIDFSIEMMIDPIGTLSRNIDDEGNVFLITPNPENPPFGVTEINVIDAPIEDPETGFDFTGKKESLTGGEIEAMGISNTSTGSIKKILDSYKAKLFFKKNPKIELVEFLFYHRPLGENEKEFYALVFDLFCKKYEIDRKTGNEKMLEEIIAQIKKIRGSKTSVEPIFRKAAESIKIPVSVSDIENMNTTALNMLHVNLPTVAASFKNIKNVIGDARAEISEVKKFDGTNSCKAESRLYKNTEINYWELLRFTTGDKKIISFPNVLLTSDAYLVEQADADKFYYRYKNYWQYFWLFQVPHHGSKKNINRLLLARLKLKDYVFINYGTRHQFDTKYIHPDKEVISDLVATGCSGNVLPVNEFTGLKFYFSCNDH